MLTLIDTASDAGLGCLGFHHAMGIFDFPNIWSPSVRGDTQLLRELGNQGRGSRGSLACTAHQKLGMHWVPLVEQPKIHIATRSQLGRFEFGLRVYPSALDITTTAQQLWGEGRGQMPCLELLLLVVACYIM